MAKQAEICETYQLKWSSYNSYIHSCISTSLHNDSFADVALVTTDGHQIMAHRFVLSYSSLFLAQILKMQRKVTTALPLMIVLPPEIDHKSLKVLIRYMYSGEAKVSKEILNNVLRGGDILQVKGLYREKQDQEKSVKITQNSASKPPSIVDSPVSSPTPTAPAIPAIPATNQSQKPSSHPLSQKKQPQQQQQQPPPLVKAPDKPVTNAGTKFIVVQKTKEPVTYSHPRQKVLNFTIMQNFDKNAPAKDESSKAVTILNKTLNQSSTTNDGEKDDHITIKSEPKDKDNLQFLMIKDEPIDWTDADMEIIDTKEVYEEMTIKSEHTETNESGSNADEEEEIMFSPLTCELCTERFTIPAEWVRHVQSHTDMLPAKRRRRDSTGDSYENDTFPELMCDMCQKTFATPAEWVRHIQNSHSEFELHMSNRKAPKNKDDPSPSTSATSSAQVAGSPTDKFCRECNKSFPSHASMVIHQRSHTGEKPYSCEYCPKTFNVKSNLLRHLRTLHNKMINSGELVKRKIFDQYK